MVALYLVLILLLLGILYLLTAPFYLEINTTRNLYRVRFHHWASVRVYATQESVFMEVRLFGWTRSADLLARKSTARQRPAKSSAKKKSVLSFRKILAVVRSFKIKRCYATIDTGDEALNGILYPLAYRVKRLLNQPVAINFTGRNEMVLQLENNFMRIILAYARS